MFLQQSLLAFSLLVASVQATDRCDEVSFKFCTLMNLKTNVGVKLNKMSQYMVKDGDRFSVGCKVKGPVGEVRYIFPGDTNGDSPHTEKNAPYWMNGDSMSDDSRYVNPVPYLQTTGDKMLTVAGYIGEHKCFEKSFSMKAMTSMPKKPATCQYSLGLGNDKSQGKATATITPKSLTIEYKGAKPNTLYTVWVDFRNRATSMLSADYPAEDGKVDLAKTGPGNGRGVAPAFGTMAPVFEGMKVDLNGFVTDRHGNGKFRVNLDYNLLAKSSSPVVAATLSMQGGNRVGGSWLRMYEGDLADGPSSQVLDKNGTPKLVYATAQGLTIVGHFKPFSHGHTPGVGGVDHFPGFKGDFPAECME